MYRGVGGRGGVPDMPSPMSRARVNCIACHKQEENSSADAQFAGQTFLAVQQSCDGCHGNKYEGSLAEWKSTIAANTQRAESGLVAAQQSLAQHSGTVSPETKLAAQRLIDDADYNIRFVKLAHGVHNVNYATALLNVAIENCNQARRLLGDTVATGDQKPSGGTSE
jgi:formate-dependent nitrite reductase cytochrome c552 subunit